MFVVEDPVDDVSLDASGAHDDMMPDPDDVHDDDYLMISDGYCLDELLMMTEIEPLLDDVVLSDDGVSLVQLMRHMINDD